MRLIDADYFKEQVAAVVPIQQKLKREEVIW